MEIERKFIVTNDSWFNYKFKSIKEIEQVYISFDPCIRIRISDLLQSAKMCCKMPTDNPMVREEIEFDIDYDHARKVVDVYGGKQTVLKERFVIDIDGKDWEIDRFCGDNIGLVVAEIELESSDEDVVIPDFVGKEVTEDMRFLNVNLAQNPYLNWKNDVE